MITFKHHGNFNHAEMFLKRSYRNHIQQIMNRYGEDGVHALSQNTPVETGLTASSWHYGTTINKNGFSLGWYNTNENNGVNVAVILQYGHGTGTGGFVVGRDYINPALQPIFDKMVNDIWQEVIR